MRKAGMRGRAWMAAMALWLALSSVWPAMAVSIDLSVPETAESSGFSLEVIAAAKNHPACPAGVHLSYSHLRSL